MFRPVQPREFVEFSSDDLKPWRLLARNTLAIQWARAMCMCPTKAHQEPLITSQMDEIYIKYACKACCSMITTGHVVAQHYHSKIWKFSKSARRREASAEVFKLHASYKQQDTSSFEVRPQEPKKGQICVPVQSILVYDNNRPRGNNVVVVVVVFFFCRFLMLIFNVDF